MTRKRNRYTRSRAKRSRPNTPAPKNGWLIADLARLSATPIRTIRTIRTYVEQRLLQPSEFRGTATRYPRRELLRLFAVLRARTETRLTLAEIRKRLDALSEPELESLLRTRPTPPALATVLAANSTSPPTSTPVPTPTEGTDVPRSAFEGQLIESWQRIRLAPAST